MILLPLLLRWSLSLLSPLLPRRQAFSSCLDVAAIEMDNGEPLDVNAELTTVGWSNVASGLLGGFTGSYIFSQTIFTSRSGCRSRVVGAVVCAAELGIVFLQVSFKTHAHVRAHLGW